MPTRRRRTMPSAAGVPHLLRRTPPPVSIRAARVPPEWAVRHRAGAGSRIPRARVRTSESSGARTDARPRILRPARRKPRRRALHAEPDRYRRTPRSTVPDRHCDKCPAGLRPTATAHPRWRRQWDSVRPANDSADPAAIGEAASRGFGLHQTAAASCRPLIAATTKLTGDLQLRHQFAQCRDVVIALDHGQHHAELHEYRAIEIPDRLDDRMVMSVDEMSAEIAVAGEMKLTNPVRRDGLQVCPRVEAVIDAADV